MMNIGDRVEVVAPRSEFHGKTGVVVHVYEGDSTTGPNAATRGVLTDDLIGGDHGPFLFEVSDLTVTQTLVERLHEITMDGGCQEGGNVEHSAGWFALVEDMEDQDYILRIDNNGNKTVEGPFSHIEIDAEHGGYYSPAEVRLTELANEYGDDEEGEDFTDEWAAAAANLDHPKRHGSMN